MRLIYILITFALFSCTERNISVKPIDPVNVLETTDNTTIADVVKVVPGPANVVVPGNAKVDTSTATVPIVVEPVIIEEPVKIIVVKKKIDELYLSQVGVREKTGKNDGAEVEMYLKAVGLGKGYAWCAAFVRWCFDNVGTKTTITAWSPTAHNSKNIIYANRKFAREPVAGDVVCFYYPNLGRIAHTGFYNRRISSTTYESVEGNTSSTGSREGDGVYIKYRPFNSTYSITRWIK